MIQRLIPSGVAAAISGGTMAVALSCCPSVAFTLSAPSLAQSGRQTSSRSIITATITATHIIITATITLITTVITTTHIASVTMYPRQIPTITIRRSPVAARWTQVAIHLVS